MAASCWRAFDVVKFASLMVKLLLIAANAHCEYVNPFAADSTKSKIDNFV